MQEQDDMLEVITEPTNLYAVKKSLEDAGFSVESAELSYIPGTIVDIAQEEHARKVINLLQLLKKMMM